MKNAQILAISLFLLVAAGVFYAGDTAAGQDSSSQYGQRKIRIIFQQREVIVAMFDNPASKDFISLLPLTLDFRDFAKAEKIADLPRRLNTAGAPTSREATGDLTYYAPWGNLAVFYKGVGTDGQLYILGRIEEGKDALVEMNTNFTARIERVE